MAESPLTSFWIEGPSEKGPLGYGVTGFSIEDAYALVEAAGYSLPNEKKTLRYRTVRSIDDVPVRFAREHSGPVILRGLWYPFTRIGVTS